MARAHSPLSFLPSPAASSLESVDSAQLPSLEQIPSASVVPPRALHAPPAQITSGSNAMMSSSLNALASPSRQPWVDPATVPKFCSQPGSPIAYPASFIDQSRALLDQQRRNFDQERLLFDQERAMWDTERQALYERITELERAAGNTQVKAPLDSSAKEPPPARMSSWTQQPRPASEGPRAAAEPMKRQSSLPGSGDKFWEGGSSRQGSMPSRVFAPPPSHDGRLPTIQERHGVRVAPAGVARMSPEGEQGLRGEVAEVAMVGQGVDISLIQHDLDGITLKSSALPPSVMAKVRPPSPLRLGTNGRVHLPTADLAPAVSSSSSSDVPFPNSGSGSGSGVATPTQTSARLHRPSLAHQRGDSDTWTAGSKLDDDPELQGPLSLVNDGAADSRFLEALDSKLLHEARKILYSPPPPPTSSSDTAAEGSEVANLSHSSLPRTHAHPPPLPPPSLSSSSSLLLPENTRTITTTTTTSSRTTTGADEHDPSSSSSSCCSSPSSSSMNPTRPAAADPEPDIRLKFKRSMNFGTAFGSGVLRAT